MKQLLFVCALGIIIGIYLVSAEQSARKKEVRQAHSTAKPTSAKQRLSTPETMPQRLSTPETFTPRVRGFQEHEPSAGTPAVNIPRMQRTPPRNWRDTTVRRVHKGVQTRIKHLRQNPKASQRPSQALRDQQGVRARKEFQRNHSNYRKWFDHDFYKRHNLRKVHDNCWYVPTWGVVTNWFSWGWDSPYYYSNYPTEVEAPMPSQEDDGYSEYLEVAPEKIEQPSSTIPPEGQWLPFGVFSVGSSVNQAAYSTIVVQLAANKQGVITGTYYNSATDKTQGISGHIDSQTQQASWMITGQPDSPVMITSTFNLTQDVVPVKMYFEDGREQNWFYIRITR